VKSTKVKLVTATAGAGAVLAMGALSVAFSETSSADPAPPGPVSTTPVTTGATVTETTAPSEPSTSIAQPTLTGPAPLFPGENP
jgi:hypothetical protein